MKNTYLLATIVAGVTLLCLWLPAKAQHPCQEEVTQNSLWSLPDLYAQFPDDESPPELSNLPIPPDAAQDDDYTGEIPKHAHNAIHDQNGELLFFNVDDHVCDGNGYGMYRFRGANGEPIYGNSEICVVPDPGNCERYHIFLSSSAHPGEGNVRYPYYSLLDMSATNLYYPDKLGAPVNGQFASGNAQRLADAFDFENANGDDIVNITTTHAGYTFAASPLLSDGASRLVLASVGSAIFRMGIDENGVQPINPAIQLEQIFTQYSGSSQGITEDVGKSELELIKLSNGNLRVGTVFNVSQPANTEVIAVFDIDENGDYIQGTAVSYLLSESGTEEPLIKGLEFSGDGDYLYFTHHVTPDNPNAVEYIDIVNQQRLSLNVANDADFQYSQIELGSDGFMYFAYADGLALLTDPDNPNVNNWNAPGFPISNYPLSDNGYPQQDNNKAYLLPDQIDGMNYYDHFLVEEDVECCLHHPPYDEISYTAANSGTWSPSDNPFHEDPECNVVLINNELRIPSGVYVTIRDMLFEFSEYARVIVEPGGRLYLDNTVFTYGPCGERMWLGVEVWGDPTASQWPMTNQGHLYLYNNSAIAHARIGAVAGSRNGVVSSPPVFTSATGGVIRATDSHFINNQRDVVIQNYIGEMPSGNLAANRSHFNRCNFVTESLLNYPELVPITRADLVKVKDIRFKDCSFRNMASFFDFEIEDRGKGISSVDATFHVSGNNEPYTGDEDAAFQTFYQLETGVDVNGFEEHYFTVENMEFQGNFMGIYVKGACFETITFNNFHIPEFYNARGAELINSYLFTVEENHFFSGPENSKNTGLVIDNSSKGVGEEEDAQYDGEQVENEVYRNIFEDLWGGIIVKNDNRGEIDQHGLQARCNEFDNNQISDIFLSSYSEWRVNQGVLSPPEARTNNVFSWPSPICDDSYTDLRVSDQYGANAPGGSLYFNYHSFENAETRPVMDAFYEEGGVLLCNQPQMYVIENDNDFDYETHCPTNFDPNGDGKYHIGHLLQRQGDAENNLEAAKLIYKTTIDGGSTQDVVTLLQNTYNDESAYLRDLLLENYPLSRQALMAAIDAAESFDPWHLTQVLVANSPLPGDVYRFLNNNEVLSSFFMQFIHDAQNNSEASLARLLQSEISLRSYEKSHAERDIHRHFLVHTDSIDAGAWHDYVSGRDETYYQLYRIGDHLSKGEIAAAQLLRDSLNIHPDRLNWIDFRIALATADTITSVDISEGWNFWNKSATRGDAWGWLTGVGELDSIPPLPEVVEHRNFSINSKATKAEAERWLQAWPNPAKDHVILTYPREADAIGTVQVFGPKGEFIRQFSASDIGFEEINVTDWSPGLYIAKLIVEGKTIESIKFNVVR